jgi:hypothetical protein
LFEFPTENLTTTKTSSAATAVSERKITLKMKIYNKQAHTYSPFGKVEKKRI